MSKRKFNAAPAAKPDTEKTNIASAATETAEAIDTKNNTADQSATIGERVMRFIKSRQTIGFLISVAVMAIIALAFFYPDNFDGNSLRQHDMQQGYANGQEIVEYQAETGTKSWWTNALFSGMPAFQISPSYPSDSLFRWITSVYGLGLPSPSNLLFMMMLGFMILMMAMKVRWEYGLIGAIAWGFSTYFIIIIGAGHIWKFVTLAYIPPTIAGVVLAYRGRYLAGGALAALFMMMQLMSNHIQMSYYFGFVILALAVAYLIEALKKKTMKRWSIATGVVIAAIALGALANLPNMYHTAKYAKETQRADSELKLDEPTEEGAPSKLDYITGYSYGKNETWTLLIPNVKGGSTVKIVNGSPTLLPLSEVKTNSGIPYELLSQMPQYFGEPESTNGPVYVGAIIFVLFVLGCIVVKGPLKWALLTVTILSIFLAWGRNMMFLTEIFVDYVPMYSKFRTPESILVIAEFAMPLLAILGLYKIFSTPDGLKVYWKPIVWSFGIVGVISFIGFIFPSVFGLEDGMSAQIGEVYPEYYNGVLDVRGRIVSDDSLRTLIFVALAFATLWCASKKYISNRWTVAIIGVLVLIDLYSVNKRYLSSDSFVKYSSNNGEMVEMTDVDLQLLNNGDKSYYRVLDADRFQDAAPSAFHHTIGGYHAAKLGRYNDLINSGLIFDEYVFSMLNAKYIVQGGQIHQNPNAMGNAWFIDKIDYTDTPTAEFEALKSKLQTPTEAVADKQFQKALGQPSQLSEGDTITLTSYAPDKLTYKSHSANDNIGVFSEIYFPWGWTATIDGKPAEIGRVNYVLRALRIPKGDHTIVFTFDPKSVHQTVSVAYIAVIIIYLALIAAIVLPFIRRKKQ